MWWLQVTEVAVLVVLAGGVWFSVVRQRAAEWRVGATVERAVYGLTSVLERNQEALTALSRMQLTDGRHEPHRGETYHGYPLDEMIRQAEIRNDIHLTWTARQLILLPIVEGLDQGEDVGFAQLAESIDAVVATTRHEPSSDERTESSRGAKSVIKAFHRRFCNIPPFCSRREEERSS